MPKATWGTGEEALTAADIDGVDTSQNYKPYAGDIPPSGLYRFVLKRAKKAVSQANNPKIMIRLALDGTWKPQHAKYEGCPLFDHLPMTKSAAFRSRAFTDALGVSSSDLLQRTILDEDGYIEKIGKLKIADEDLLVYCTVAREQSEQYGVQLKMNGAGYVAVDDDEGTEDDGDDEGEPPPF